MSTNSQPDEKGKVKRRQKDGKKIDVSCPTAIIKYNRFMGGVDRNDQLRSYYHVHLKCRKYYKYIFWFLFEVSVSNSFILFTRYCNRTDRDPALRNLLDFRLKLYQELVGNYCSRRRPGRGVSVRSNLLLRHYPMKNRAASRSGMSRCWYCAHTRQPQRRRETVWYCGDCGLHLCHTGETDGSDCFLLHHQNHVHLQE